MQFGGENTSRAINIGHNAALKEQSNKKKSSKSLGFSKSVTTEDFYRKNKNLIQEMESTLSYYAYKNLHYDYNGKHFTIRSQRDVKTFKKRFVKKVVSDHIAKGQRENTGLVSDLDREKIIESSFSKLNLVDMSEKVVSVNTAPDVAVAKNEIPKIFPDYQQYTDEQKACLHRVALFVEERLLSSEFNADYKGQLQRSEGGESTTNSGDGLVFLREKINQDNSKEKNKVIAEVEKRVKEAMESFRKNAIEDWPTIAPMFNKGVGNQLTQKFPHKDGSQSAVLHELSEKDNPEAYEIWKLVNKG